MNQKTTMPIIHYLTTIIHPRLGGTWMHRIKWCFALIKILEWVKVRKARAEVVVFLFHCDACGFVCYLPANTEPDQFISRLAAY